MKNNRAVGEFDSPAQFRFTLFKNRAEVPTGALGSGAVVFTRSTGASL